MNGFEKVMVDIGKGIEWPFKHGVALLTLIDKGLTDAPEVRDAVKGLIAYASTVAVDGAIVVSSKGMDLPADMAELIAAKALFGYVTGTFLPEMEKVFGDLKPQIEQLTAETTEPASVPQIVPPGLHTTVAA